jgi:3-dehydroquinate dehydratase-2
VRASAGPGRPLRVLVVNGPNLNLLGTREPAIYGRETLAEITGAPGPRPSSAPTSASSTRARSSTACNGATDASTVNAGLTHTSVSLRDALLGIERPFVEVHLSDPATREPFRRVTLLEDVALARFVGKRAAGYHRALEELARRWEAGEIAPRAFDVAAAATPEPDHA